MSLWNSLNNDIEGATRPGATVSLPAQEEPLFRHTRSVFSTWHGNPGFSFRRPASALHFLGVPLFLLLSFYWIDETFIPSAFFLPLLLYLVLGYLALRFEPWVVFFWAAVYAGVIFTVLYFSLTEGMTEPVIRPYLRAATFLTGGMVVAVLAAQRGRLEKGYGALLHVISSMPVAVIVSDSSGNILLLNPKAQELLNLDTHSMAGISYFSTFTNPREQGRAIAKYVNYFDPKNAGPFSVVLQTRGKHPLVLNAVITMIGDAESRFAVTIIERIAEPEPA